MVVAVVMMVPGPVIMVMMRASRRFIQQLAVKIRCNHRFHKCAGFTGANDDALLRKEVMARRPMPPAMTTLAPCSRSQRGKTPGACGGGVSGRMLTIFRLFGVGLHERKFLAAAKVSVKPAFG